MNTQITVTSKPGLHCDLKKSLGKKSPARVVQKPFIEKNFLPLLPLVKV